MVGRVGRVEGWWVGIGLDGGFHRPAQRTLLLTAANLLLQPRPVRHAQVPSSPLRSPTPPPSCHPPLPPSSSPPFLPIQSLPSLPNPPTPQTNPPHPPPTTPNPPKSRAPAQNAFQTSPYNNRSSWQSGLMRLATRTLATSTCTNFLRERVFKSHWRLLLLLLTVLGALVVTRSMQDGRADRGRCVLWWVVVPGRLDMGGGGGEVEVGHRRDQIVASSPWAVVVALLFVSLMHLSTPPSMST